MNEIRSAESSNYSPFVSLGRRIIVHGKQIVASFNWNALRSVFAVQLECSFEPRRYASVFNQ